MNGWETQHNGDCGVIPILQIKQRDSTCGCPFRCILLSPSRVHLYSCAIGFHLSQRGEVVIIFRQVCVKDCTIMFRHGKGAMSQEFLQSKGIAATINQILSGKGVAEQMDACLLDTPPRVIPCYGLPQAVLCQLRAGFCAKEVISRLPASVPQILPQNGYHGTTKGNDLGFSVLCVAVEHHPSIQIHISDLNCSNCRGSAAAVQ